ncbi:MAG: hypothetical protein HDKAJFGB_01878 [Anaerolineae bacterium]|nr:hypothetical protein [Anaerolineae bacterium]
MLPLGLVAVVVIKSVNAAVYGTVMSIAPLPKPSVVTEPKPKYNLPSPKPEPSQAKLEKISTRYVVDGAALSVPTTRVLPWFALVKTGASCKSLPELADATS